MQQNIVTDTEKQHRTEKAAKANSSGIKQITAPHTVVAVPLKRFSRPILTLLLLFARQSEPLLLSSCLREVGMSNTSPTCGESQIRNDTIEIRSNNSKQNEYHNNYGQNRTTNSKTHTRFCM